MTEPSHPDADLELASAYLDAETTEVESAAVEADPRLLALVDELGAVRTRMPPGPAPDGLVDHQVAAALGSLGAAGRDATVRPLDRGRGAVPWYQRIPVAAVAAALVVVALLGAVALRGPAGDDDETATSAEETTMEAATDDASELDATAGAAADGSASPDLGAERPLFADLDALAAHVEGLLAGDDAAAPQPEAAPAAGGSGGVEDGGLGTPSEPRAAPGCDPVAVAAPDPSSVTAVVTAVVGGRDVTAVVVEGDGRRMVVVDDATCDVVDERPV